MVSQSLPMPTALDRIAPQSARNRWRPHGKMAACVAILGHAAVLAALVGMAAHRLPEPADMQGYALVLSQPAPAVVPAPVPAVSAQPARPLTAVQPAAPPAPHARLIASLHNPAASAPHPVARAAAVTGDASAAAPSPHPATAARQSAPDSGPALAALEANIDAAVRRRAVMPAQAIRQRREGRAQVRFSYVDGAVDQVAVAQSSQSRLLDDAALLAVRSASYPVPPPGLRGRRLGLQVWIDFRVQASPG